jgi:hypothetical protein
MNRYIENLVFGLFSHFSFIFFSKLIADGLPPGPSSSFVQEPNSTSPTREPSPTLRPATPPSIVSKINCAKIPSKKTKVKPPRKLRSSINLGSSKVENFKEDLQIKIKNIRDIRTQKLSPLQAGQLASELAQDLLELASFQACLQEEYKYMLELSLSGSK